MMGYINLLLCRPALQLPGASKPVVAVRFCPLTFSLRESNSGTFMLMYFAILLLFGHILAWQLFYDDPNGLRLLVQLASSSYLTALSLPLQL